jgi:hypothetical protein
MRAKRRLTGLIATLMSIGAFLVGSVVGTLDGYHDISHPQGIAAASSTAPYASLDGYHDI